MDSLTQLITVAVTMGLVSNLHCIGMCGPISMALPLNRKNTFTTATGVGVYTLGRSLGYGVLGVIVGVIGYSAQLVGALQILSIVSGVLLLLFAWKNYYNNIPQFSFLNKWVSQKMSQIFKNNNDKGRNKRLGSFGFINAFLPCGMVYFALFTALTSGNVAHSVTFMILFGMATLPGFLGVALLKNQLHKIRLINNKIVIASFVSIIGVVMILRGLNLDIPMISPKMEVVQNKNTKVQEEVVLSCCQKKGNCSIEKETITD